MEQLHILDYSQGIGDEMSAFTHHARVEPDVVDEIRLLTALQKSLDLNVLLKAFAHHVAKYCRIGEITFHCGEEPYSVSFDSKTEFSRQFSITLANQKTAYLTYSTRQPLTVMAIDKLHYLHQFIIHPLTNALEYRRVQSLANRDALTHLRNRGSFDENLAKAISLAARREKPLTLMLIDLDEFKSINDNFGHAAGDDVIKAFAKVLCGAIRNSDVAYRFGGDEFAVLIEEGQSFAPEHIFRRVQMMLKHQSVTQRYNLTCSIGVATLEQGECQKSLFMRADKALYQAKADGKGRLKVS